MHVHVARLEQVDAVEVIAPIPVRRQVLQLAHADLVVIFDWVAQLYTRARCFRQFCFQRHDLLCLIGRFFRRLA